MSYFHSGDRPAYFRRHPIDPDNTDWVFFVYDSWLRTNESITVHSAKITGGVIETDSTYLGTVDDESGTTYNEVYGVRVSVSSGANEITVTHVVTTTVVGGLADYGRGPIDLSAKIPVQQL